MKLAVNLLFLALFLVGSVSAQNGNKKDFDMLLSARISSKENVTILMFFSNGTYNVEKQKDGEQVSFSSKTLADADLKRLKKLIKTSRPIVLNNIYSCNKKPVNRYNATILNFFEAKKKVIIDNDCKTNRQVKNLQSYINEIIEMTN